MAMIITSRISNDCYQDQGLPTLQSPWWQHLPTDFHRQPDQFDTNRLTRTLVNATAAIDAGVRTGLAGMVSAAALPGLLNSNQMREERAQFDFYCRFADASSPHEFFREPEKVSRVHRQKAAPWHFRPEDGKVKALHFESPFTPVNPALRDRYLSHSRNRTAWAQHWQHRDGPRPTIIVVHGFVADPYWINTRFLSLPWFYKQGYDVLLYTMPFHGKRQDRLSPFSGSGFFRYGLSHVNEAFAHTIHDLRIFMRYLRDLGVEEIGATGISLGGYTSAMLSCVEDSLNFVIPNVPVVSLIDLMLGWFPLNVEVTGAMRRQGLDITDLRHVTAMHSALNWPSLVPPEKRLIIGGAGDRFVPPKQIWLLWQHWQQCALHWFPGNHLIHLDQGRYLKDMRRFLESVSSLTPGVHRPEPAALS
ncbi:MAG: alpha/beta hydrolase family protein [Alcanivoracaceae bacterium]|nr:alpha/beta hydrolase family protein [Alcanivoracaceae bacterium]